MVDFLRYFKFELVWSLLFILGMVIEGFDWWLMTCLFAAALTVVYRAANYGKN